jgi:hypothetical protein
MASNLRNSRTTFPRKAARRQRAADRFSIKRDLRNDSGYMARKTQEAQSLGVDLAMALIH